MNKELIKKIFIKRNIDILFVAIAILMGAYFNWKIIEIIIFGIFIWIILNPVPSRLTAIPALGFLVVTPFLLIFKNQVLAEETAIYAYYFLIMSVVMGIYEIRKEDHDHGTP
ncbi:MAG: hypothetical protein NTZ97_00495 [Candidatus Moranbacteria bacterium]|nr:hypothetical protein [Candidatus Moranbacteria bacterium]